MFGFGLVISVYIHQDEREAFVCEHDAYEPIGSLSKISPLSSFVVTLNVTPK